MRGKIILGIVGCAAITAVAQSLHAGDRIDIDPSLSIQPTAAVADADTPTDAPRLRTFEMPPTVVTASPDGYHDDDLIGSYAQPRWTAHRLFPGTRVYVIPEGMVEVESWTRVEVPREGKTEWTHQEELEIGLPWRFQLDMYAIERHEGKGTFAFDQSVELRWAFADWGQFPGNPALYVEYVNQGNGDPEKVEAKLLLGDDFAPGWHWGVNLSFERELGTPFTNEYEVTFGVAHTLIDGVLSLGMEGKFSWTSVNDNRSELDSDLQLGPSLQWRPIPAMHVDLSPLFGMTSTSHLLDLFLVVGWEF